MGIKLDLGAGPIPFRKRTGFEDWKDSVTMDAHQYGDIDIVADIGERIPLDDMSVSDIKCIEVIEHIPYAKTDKFISEIYRVLELGGRLQLQCPNFATCAKSFLTGGLSDEEAMYAYLCIIGQQTNDLDIHRNIFTPDSLVEKFQRMHFSVVRSIEMKVLQYPDQGWNGKYHIQLEAIK